MKVLFVPSTPFLSAALKVMLYKAGFTLIISENTRNPKGTLEKVQPDIIITDITQCGGIEYVSEAKQLNLPVIVVSANGKERDLQKAFDKGADDYVCLPLSISELVLRVSILSKTRIAEFA